MEPYSDQELTILILAAGAARRFGEDKRRICLYGSTELLQATVLAQLETGFPVTLALSARAGDDDLADQFSPCPIRILRCENADQGMGATLAEAVANIPENSSVAVVLGDMPLILPATVRSLASRLRPGGIIYPRYRGQRGHPVLFSSAFIPLLRARSGDRGAAALLDAHRDLSVALTVDDPGVCLDADTPDALAVLRRVYASRNSSGVSG